MNPDPQVLEQIDHLLDTIDHCPPPNESAMAHEHIQEARNYLLGAMPAEFRLNLDLARESLARMPETDSRRAAQKLLGQLIDADQESDRERRVSGL